MTMMMEDDNGKGAKGVFQRKRMSKSTNEQGKKRGSSKKGVVGKSAGEFAEEEQLQDTATNNEDLTPSHEGAAKYFSSVIEDGHVLMDGSGKNGNANLLMMNMASIDSNSEFASNPINNKNNRKLKRLPQQ